MFPSAEGSTLPSPPSSGPPPTLNVATAAAPPLPLTRPSTLSGTCGRGNEVAELATAGLCDADEAETAAAVVVVVVACRGRAVGGAMDGALLLLEEGGGPGS